MKNSFLLAFLAFLLVGCTAKDTKTAGGNMMSAAGSGGLAAAPIFFAAGGLVYAIGSSTWKMILKVTPIFGVIENNSTTRDLHHSATSDNNNTEVFAKPYELL